MTQNNFAKDGFILKKNLFTEEEINKLNNYIENSSKKEKDARQTSSSTGKLSISFQKGNVQQKIAKNL